MHRYHHHHSPPSVTDPTRIASATAREDFFTIFIINNPANTIYTSICHPSDVTPQTPAPVIGLTGTTLVCIWTWYVLNKYKYPIPDAQRKSRLAA
ncbi:hypothetical protein K443DRAFT_492387 [Laccaria amethystina LaAM-08-1]|uniref:Uncharacterized protein n=1 Tax=Laccaria amethystina LaAM-08-1 TaxID=1095629 RepID=A0A0C9WHJ0_9AGAR|nr:hypothetical protein K443DRAFT_492387 [Laccaria amethystina LaAM-08-1]